MDALRQLYEETRSIEHVRSDLAQGCWIYGGGGYGRRVFDELSRQGFECLGFVDRRGADAEFAASMPRPVHTPDDFPAHLASGKPLVVGVMNTSDSFLEPDDWGRSKGFRSIILPGLLPDVLGSSLDNYWLTTRSVTADHLGEIGAVADLLADPLSRQILHDLLRFRLSGAIQDHPAVDIRHQYVPPDLPIDKQGMILVDGGAFVGDTYENLTALGAEIAEWYAFEPDLENFKRLAGVASTGSAKASLFPCGLADRTADVGFSDGEGSGSHLSSGGGIGHATVRVMALDDALAGVEPTLVKLDIEGFEAEALLGMKTMLVRAKPVLAVCIYHKPDDLWTLPQLVRRLVPDSKLYIRQHGHNGFDTVLYAIP